MNMKIQLASLLAIMLAFGGNAFAQDMPTMEHEAEAEHCLSLNMIDRTDVVDDRNILFYMRDDRVYRNILPHRCPGLKFEETFMYRTSIGRLCDLDMITILDDIGFGLRRGPSCGLGMFHPITEEEAEDIQQASR